MNTIITLRRLVELLAKANGCDTATAETFVRVFTSTVRDSLVAGESVKIKGIGEFKVMQGKIVMVPDADLAAYINAPFAMFEPQEIDAGFNISDLDRDLPAPSPAAPAEEKPSAPVQELPAANDPIEIDAPSEPELPAAEEENLPAAEEEDLTAPADDEEDDSVQFVPVVAAEKDTQAPSPQNELIGDSVADNPSKDNPSKSPLAAPENIYINTAADPEEEEAEDDTDPVAIPAAEPAFPWFWTLMGLICGLIVGIAIGFFVHDPIEEALEPSLGQQASSIYDDEADAEPVEEDGGIAVDDKATEAAAEAANPVQPEAAEQPAQPKADQAAAQPAAQQTAPKTSEVVKITVKNGDKLATLAQRHYGSKDYWSYIFIENEKVIKNPNRLAAGMVLVIPPIEKYAKEPTEEERRKAAAAKGAELIRKYPN